MKLGSQLDLGAFISAYLSALNLIANLTVSSCEFIATLNQFYIFSYMGTNTRPVYSCL